VDPASYLFHKAVCEYGLMMKDRADMSIDRLLVDVVDSPEGYRMVAALMHFDMLTQRRSARQFAGNGQVEQSAEGHARWYGQRQR
jgi:hypothetical protein